MSADGHKRAVAAFLQIIAPQRAAIFTLDMGDSILGGKSSNKGKYKHIIDAVSHLNVHIDHANGVLERGWVSDSSWSKLNTWEKFMLDDHYELYIVPIPFRVNRCDSETISIAVKLKSFDDYLNQCSKKVQAWPPSDMDAIREAKRPMLSTYPSATRTYAETLWNGSNRSILKIVLGDNMRRLRQELQIDDADYYEHIWDRITTIVRQVRKLRDASTLKGKNWQTTEIQTRIQALAANAPEQRYRDAFLQILRNRCLLMGITRKYFSTARAVKPAPLPNAFDRLFFSETEDASAEEAEAIEATIATGEAAAGEAAAGEAAAGEAAADEAEADEAEAEAEAAASEAESGDGFGGLGDWGESSGPIDNEWAQDWDKHDPA